MAANSRQPESAAPVQAHLAPLVGLSQRIPEDSPFAVAWTGVDGRRHRMIFQPRLAGGYTRIVQRRIDAGAWVDTGTEIVAEVDATVGAEEVR